MSLKKRDSCLQNEETSEIPNPLNPPYQGEKNPLFPPYQGDMNPPWSPYRGTERLQPYFGLSQKEECQIAFKIKFFRRLKSAAT
jgi:hypothetical protein